MWGKTCILSSVILRCLSGSFLLLGEGSVNNVHAYCGCWFDSFLLVSEGSVNTPMMCVHSFISDTSLFVFARLIASC